MEKFAVSRLVGAPPGYVGYEEGGQLTEKVRRKPYSVILLDEIEKAHPDVFNMLLQVLDDGRLTDSYGRKVDFRNTLLIMTSNLGSRDLGSLSGFGFGSHDGMPIKSEMETAINNELKRAFNPEFLNRLDEVVIFNSLNRENIHDIIDILIKDVSKRLVERKLTLDLLLEAKEFIAEKGYEPSMGARPLKRMIQRYLEDPLSEEILSGKFDDGAMIRVGHEGDALTFTAVDMPDTPDDPDGGSDDGDDVVPTEGPVEIEAGQ